MLAGEDRAGIPRSTDADFKNLIHATVSACLASLLEALRTDETESRRSKVYAEGDRRQQPPAYAEHELTGDVAE
jgi:hypothetical protein